MSFIKDSDCTKNTPILLGVKNKIQNDNRVGG